MNFFLLRIWIMHILCIGILHAATFEFSSPSSKLVLGDYNGGAFPVQSYFKNDGGAKLIGWDQQSIVRGHSQANTFTYAWTCSVVNGTVSVDQVSYDLVVSSSNMAPLVRATSNVVNALSPIVQGTSQWVINNDGWLRGTSNTVNNLFPIVRAASKWVVNNSSVLRATSNWVSAKAPLIRTTSNAVNAMGAFDWANLEGRVTTVEQDLASLDTSIDIIRTTSNAVNVLSPILKGTSQWVSNNNSWLRSTSKTVNNIFPIIRGSSQWIANNASVVRGTSNSVLAWDGLIRTTSDAVNAGWPLLKSVSNAINFGWPLLRATSNAVNSFGVSGGSFTPELQNVLLGTSQWVFNNDGWLRGSSNTVNNLFPIVRGNSQWIANNAAGLLSAGDLGPRVTVLESSVANLDTQINDPAGWLIGTSNVVNAMSPVLLGTSQWVVNNDGWLRDTSNWVAAKDVLLRTTSNSVALGRVGSGLSFDDRKILIGTSNWVSANDGLLRTTSNALNTLNDIANRGLGLASRSAADILGLQKGIAQTAFDFTVTSTAEGSYAAGSGGVVAVACNPDGNLLAVAENGNNQSAGIVYDYDNYNLAYMGSVGLRYRNATFEQSGSSGILPVDIQSYSLAWHPIGEDLLIGGSGHVLTGGFGASGVGVINHATSFPSCGLVYRSGVRQNKELSFDQATVTADQAQSWILAGLYTAYNTVSQATNGLRSDYPDLILRAIDYVRAKNYSGVRDIFGDLSATFSENYGATGPAGGTRNWQALNIIGNIQTACDRVALGQMETIPWLMADGLYYIVTCVTGFRGDLCQLTWDCSQGLDQSSRLTAAYAFRAFRLSRSITGDEAFNYACKAANVLFSTPDNGRVNQVAYSKDGQYVAVVGQALDTSKKQIHIYKSRKFESGPVATYHTGTDTDVVSHISWHPSGNFIAFSSDGSPGQNSYGILQFDGANLFVPQNHELISSASTISGLSWDPTGKYLAVAGKGFGALSLYIYDSYRRLISISTNALVTNVQPITTVEWSPDGNFLLCGHNGYSLYSVKNGFLGHVETRKGYVNPANAASWFIDGRSFILAGKDLASGNDMQLFTATQDFVNGQMLRTTSNAVNSFGVSGGSFTPELQNVLLGTSQWVFNNDGWLRGSSNTVNNLFPIIRGNSQWIANNAAGLLSAGDLGPRVTFLEGSVANLETQINDPAGWLIGTSNVVTAISPVLLGTSQWVVNNDVLLRTTSNSVASGRVGSVLSPDDRKILIGTSNWVSANAELLGATSNAVNSFGVSGGAFTPELQNVLLGTSQWVFNNDGWLRGSSNTVNNLFPIVRGNSQWIVNNGAGLLSAGDLGPRVTVLEGNVANLEAQINNPAGWLRGTSNAVSVLSPVVKGTSQWVVNNDGLVRTTSNAVNLLVCWTIPTVQNAVQSYADSVASNAQNAAQSYADGLAGNYDAAGAADGALASAQSYADSVVSNAQNAAQSYADGLAGNYDVAGAADGALASAQSYADSVAINAQNAAQSYADGLAGNYDGAGAADSALASAQSYADAIAINLDVIATSVGLPGDYAAVGNLLRATSNVCNILSPVVKGTSQWVANNDVLLRSTSNTINNVFPIVRGSSQWIANNATVMRGTSNWVAAKDMLVRTTSNAVSGLAIGVGSFTPSLQKILLGTSNWVSARDVLLRTTSNSVNVQLPLLKATSNVGNTLSPVVRGTWQWILNNDGWLRGTSKTVNNVFPIIQGNSQWIANNAGVLRGTSNWVIANDGLLRSTSNTICVVVNKTIPEVQAEAKAYSDGLAEFYDGTGLAGDALNSAKAYADTIQTKLDTLVGAAGLVGNYAAAGQLLRGTSNWAAARDVLLRTTSNAVGVQSSLLKATSNVGNVLSSVVKGTSQWVVNNNIWLRGTSKTVNNLFSIVRGNSEWIANNASLLKGNSNWVAAKDQLLRTTSNAVNAQSPLLKATSNAVSAENVRIITNETMLAQLRTNVASIANSPGGMPVNLEIGQNSYVQTTNMSVSPNSVLKFNASGARNRTINFDGNGHGLFIARNKPGVIQVDAGVNAIVRNAVLSGFDDVSVTLGKGASLTFGDGAVVELSSDVVMQRDWECAGRVTVRGFGSTLDLSGFSIALKKDANGQLGQLILEDIVLSGVSSNSLNVVDESSVVTLRDVRMNMAGMTTFAHGGLRIERNVIMSGQHVFSFVANNPLNIAANSALNIDSGTVFVYAPPSGDRSLLVMKDASSQLILNGSYFYAPAPGIQLSSGTLVAKSNNNIYNHGAKTLADAITFGNGVLANNLFIDIQPGASINVIEGKLDYRNVVR